MSKRASSAGIESLQPAPVWRYFAELAAVPRPSKHEERARAHVLAWAQQHKFQACTDAAGNVAISVPASPGREKAPVIVLQGHLDMVPEKNSGTVHDFERDPIRPVIAKQPKTGEQIVRAADTTLGADNGIGVALSMAAATESGVVHGPLELLLTVDEEAGMTGAKQLEPDFFRGRILLNLDSEEDDALYIGCAGGCDSTLGFTFPTAALDRNLETGRVSVSGLRGGHSGCDIHRNRANAIRLLAQTLQTIAAVQLQVVTFTGGSKRNAIPREAAAFVAGPAGTLDTLARSAAAVRAEAVRTNGEDGCVIEVQKEPLAEPRMGISAPDTQRLLTVLTALPHGVLAVVPEIAGLIQTSNSVSTVECEPNTTAHTLTLKIGCLSRSSSRDQLHTTARQIAAVGELSQANVDSGNEYPGWQPNVDSPTLAVCRRVYEKLFGEAPKVAAIHAGLECGLIGERVSGMDMISFGPHIEGPHSPDEHVYVASVQKMWQYLQAVLAHLSEPRP
jgi:dipeptidase D